MTFETSSISFQISSDISVDIHVEFDNLNQSVIFSAILTKRNQMKKVYEGKKKTKMNVKMITTFSPHKIDALSLGIR